MLKQLRHLIAFAWLAAALFSSAAVHAASLEKIEVGSHLGEPFYAEVPLKLEEGESVTRLFIEIAAPADYKIFEVYRDPVLGAIRADVTSDQRGARIKLTSRTRIKAPFFNLVLKVRYGRVAHFKKFAVFLEPSKSIQTAAQKAPQPNVTAVADGTAAQVQGSATSDVADAETSPESETSGPYGWARTGSYGPIVHGDVLSTVAERLRIDYRYKRYQIMAALFEKNRAKFDNENMNLLKAGSFLDVPTAAEIEQRSAKEAYQLFAKHEKQWQELTKKPRYAAVAEAQKTRYSKRVSIGEQASGAAAPAVATTAVPDTTATTSSVESKTTLTTAAKSDSAADSTVGEVATASADNSQQSAAAQADPLLAELQAKNDALQQQLLENQKSIETLTNKVSDVEAAASSARIEKLEVLLVRLQAELEKANTQVATQQTGPQWVVWLLVVLIVILLGALAVLLRREPAHPAESAGAEAVVEQQTQPDVEELLAPAGSEPPAAQAEQEEDVFDSISSFADDLSDTDTAEMEPFDPSLLDEDPDPNIDYLSEADVYVRYGMDDEALHQLNLALRLQPDSLEAHTKKAQLLRRTGDAAGYEEAKVVAGSSLGADDIVRFTAALHEAAEEQVEQDEQIETAQEAVEESVEEQQQDTAVSQAADTGIEASGALLVETMENDALDFDLSDIEVPDQAVAAQDPAMEEMDWLNDDSFAATTESSDVSIEEADHGVTQMFDNLMVEFSDDEADPDLTLEGAEKSAATPEPIDAADEDTLELVSGDATQELDNLLSEFTEQDEGPLEDAVTPSSVSTESTLVINDEMSDMEHLGHLLGDFDNDDEAFNFDTDSSELDASVFDQAESAVNRQLEEDQTVLGATQHLDILMNEFSEPADAEGSSMDDQSDSDSEIIAVEEGHDATQELSHLLSEFSEDEQDSSEQQDEMNQQDDIELDASHDATQELSHLLNEFSDDDQDSSEQQDDVEPQDDIGLATGSHGATQELDQLLSEFSDDEEDDDNKRA
ncbi:hypothetical protein MMIC_P1673 [Mariprofundus micogutta]|uniref:FimV N-terminal domain-containing protein n=1 Tax=Mariprofundus micogutta TaxID=1921010 RepID=A0A1L8CP51_9PROT|nr:FimV/HubP family polar landmark protein [Mariprofundus micogutta]GAV20700.1 hypothetical protein MMIC_P1673 [Mariprofundus micogutta]